MATNTKPPADVLLYAAPNGNADMLWFSRFHAGDPILAFSAGGLRHAAVSLLEVTRARKESTLDVVLDLNELLREARAKDPKAGLGEVVLVLARQHGIQAFSVPPEFPASLYKRITGLGLHLEIGGTPFFEARARKTPAELDCIRAANAAAAKGFEAIERALAAATVAGDGSLILQGAPLTSERARLLVEEATLRAGALNVTGLIVACGDQAVDCHASGNGPLFANQLIVADIFPRMSATGFFGDMTRTYLKGKASPGQRRLVETVRAAQQHALSLIRAGIPGKTIHEATQEFFASKGYKSGYNEKTGYQEGFFHGLGHGLGLDVHEEPSLGMRGEIPLEAGAVVTVEPGLYYIGLGGCRVEDNVVVTETGCELLSSHPYDWEIA
ncbi:MAG: Xaa-Pro peptidase family protein [Puniceicoccales bacterium]|jgi:Xaa-Pro aminopeptidase|nr:Xaa-Pro peptidase family protein [Puniceicoccales bacterium]